MGRSKCPTSAENICEVVITGRTTSFLMLGVACSTSLMFALRARVFVQSSERVEAEAVTVFRKLPSWKCESRFLDYFIEGEINH